MHTRRVRRYIIVPVVYIAAIFGLFFLQFSGTLTVRRTIDGLRFTGTLVSGEDETSRRITRARIAFHGLTFPFSEETPLVVTAADGQQTELIPQEYRVDESRLTIGFSDDTALVFDVSSQDPIELHVYPELSDRQNNGGRLVIPYGIDPAARIAAVNPISPDSRTVIYDDQEFFFSVPPLTVFDAERTQLDLALNGTTRLIRYAQLTTRQEDIVALEFAEGRREVTTVAYRNLIDEYLESAYRGWRDARYNGGSGTWDMRGQAPRFDESIVTAFLAEAWLRDEYTTAFNGMRRAADLHPEQIGLSSAVFLGDLRTVTNRFIEDDRQRAQTINRQIAANDSVVFLQNEVLPFTALRGSEELYQALLAFALRVDFRTVPLPEAIAMLSTAVEQLHPSPAATSATERFSAIIEERIYPAIRRFGDLFFVETDRAEVDLYWSIRAGILLDTAGRARDDATMRAVGRTLVTSGIQLADGMGFLPATLLLGETGVQEQTGSFGPERLYPYLTTNPWYPRMISLYDELGAGSFVWSIAQYTAINLAEDTFRFALRYPEGRTHYILMHGVPPFASMQLFGVEWRNDPRFESYIKGRHYERASQTLMIKYNDASTEEEILLFY